MVNYTLIVSLLLVAQSLQSQSIPNGSFENWNSVQGYPSPNDWSTTNIFPFFTGSEYGVTQESPGLAGNSFCRIRCVANNLGSPTPNYIVSGDYNALSDFGYPGFPINSTPTFLSGQMRSLIIGDDFATISCLFTSRDQVTGILDTIAMGESNITQTNSNWIAFDLPITQIISGNPDTCIIILKIGYGSIPEVGNYLDVDDLHFTGGTVSVEESSENRFSAWPNPMSDQLMLDLTGMENINDITLYDMQGRWVQQWQMGATQVSLDVAQLPAGAYMLHVTNRRGRWTQSMLKK